MTHTCKWLEPTLRQPWPIWLDAWSWPWCCVADGLPRLLPARTDCRDCARFEPRDRSMLPLHACGELHGRRCASGG